MNISNLGLIQLLTK